MSKQKRHSAVENNVLSTAIPTDDDGARRTELDDLLGIVGTKGTDAADGQLVDGRHQSRQRERDCGAVRRVTVVQ